MATVNNGSSSLTADSCAGCHRAHTAQGALLLKTDQESLCLTCHGAQSAGATTDVVTGVQYVSGAQHDVAAGAGTQLGALRNGGFEQARISSGNPAGVLLTDQISSAADQWAKDTVRPTPQDVTSAHLNLPDNGLSAPGRVWGNGPDYSGPGPIIGPSCSVFDARMTPSIKPWPAGDYSATGGDYWHVRVPWNCATSADDAPNRVPSALPGKPAFQVQMSAWCVTRHTRHVAADAAEPAPDSIYAYRHETANNRACTTCHVSHGSNARMEGTYSATMPFPDGTTVTYSIGGTTDASQLLKVDGRGTCQPCHDPTYTEPSNQYRGPMPTPGVP